LNYQSLVTVTNKGHINQALQNTEDYGTYRATLIVGRGSGSSENKKIFPLALESEKEILFLVSPECHAGELIRRIADEAKLTAPGNGILCGLAIKRVHGFPK